jgi:hypothetical protein
LTIAGAQRIVLLMKRLGRILLFIAAPLVLGSVLTLRSQDSPSGQDNQPIRRPPTDYMSTWMNQNTRPLGLRENRKYARLINQPRINWAIRASARHILD